MTSTLPKLTEREFMDQVTELAAIRGWQWAHFRPAKTAKGWRTPVSGPMGKGWPDLVLARKDRLVFAELKVSNRRLTPEQHQVIGILEAATETYVWSPIVWPLIEEVLR